MEHVGDTGRNRTWALGPSMRYLQMQIVGVPRPDVLYRDDGAPLKHWMVEASLDNDGRRYDVQRWIYEQLGRMTGIEELALGVLDLSREDLGPLRVDVSIDLETASLTELEDALEDAGELCCLFNYQRLEFSIESGLELLASMKELRVLDVKSRAHRIGVEELEWMHVNWPKLKEIKGLVTERRWAGEMEDGMGVKAAVEEWMAVRPRGIGSSFYP